MSEISPARSPSSTSCAGYPRQSLRPAPPAIDRDRTDAIILHRRTTAVRPIWRSGDYFASPSSVSHVRLRPSNARQLRLDEDLAETIALAHDLGHPPFGHAGERALDTAMRSAGGFDHNAQSVRLGHHARTKISGVRRSQSHVGDARRASEEMGRSPNRTHQLPRSCADWRRGNHSISINGRRQRPRPRALPTISLISRMMWTMGFVPDSFRSKLFSMFRSRVRLRARWKRWRTGPSRAEPSTKSRGG